jgi:serine/threonine protein phosphatase PrpC
MIPNKLNLEVGARTETGYVRNENQDRMSWAPVPWGQLYIIADGMGGHAGGSKAAELTIRGLEKSLTEASKNLPVEEAIHNAFKKTNRDVYDQAHMGDPTTEGMGSTAVMLLIFNQIAKIAHVGDSRAYLYRKGKLSQLTKDHTQVQRMVDAGMLTPEQARNHPSASILDRAIGNRPNVTIDISSDLILKNGDGILLCSDGLSGYADDQEIEAAMDDSLTSQENVDRLINMALQKGGGDNVTIQFIRFGKRSKVYRNDYIGLVKLILMAVLIVGMVGAAGFATNQIISKTTEENILIIKKAIYQQVSIIIHYIQKMRELADQSAKIKICISDFDLISENKKTQKNNR